GSATASASFITTHIKGAGTFSVASGFSPSDANSIEAQSGPNGRVLTITGGGLTLDRNLLTASTGDLVLAPTGPFTNLSAGALSQVDFTAQDSNTVFLPDDADVSALQSSFVSLINGGDIKWRNTALGHEQSLEDTLRTIGSD